MAKATLNELLPDIEQNLALWVDESKQQCKNGKVASYIPELAKGNKAALGVYMLDASHGHSSAGDIETVFTLQSISKVFSLLLALMDNGEEAVFHKVGMEPTGDSFNSMLKLELVQPGIPFNPLINAGAIAISSLIKGNSQQHKLERILHFFRKCAQNDQLQFNKQVYQSELYSADLNRSIAYLLKDNGVLEHSVEAVLEIYFHHCSIDATVKDLARMGLLLAYNGTDPITGEQIIPKRYVQIAKSFMVTCGMYNASGQFAIQVGLPAKSGVSGGILSLIPGIAGIGVIGPALNSKGNSIAGVDLLEKLSNAYDLNMF